MSHRCAVVVHRGGSFDPWAYVANIVLARQERRFLEQMRAPNRLMPWPEFLKALEDKRGTLIDERLSFGGYPARYWWTPDDVLLVAPAQPDPEYLSTTFSAWSYLAYTNSATGKAFLVAGSYMGEQGDTFESVRAEISIPIIETLSPG